eukprot:402806_1
MTASSLALLFGLTTQTLFQTVFSGYPVTKTAHLKPSTLATVPDVSLTTGASVTMISDKWNVNVKTQTGSDIHLSLGSDWGFHPEYPSTISFSIDGNTSLSSFNDDGDILFVFSVDNQHFSEIVSIDTRRSAYKQCPISTSPLITRDVTQMTSSTQPQRYYRFCQNAVDTPNANVLDHWINHAPQYKTPGQWPMLLSITNNPVLNTTRYSWTDDPSTNPSKVSSQYVTSFASNRGFDMFMSGDNLNEDFFVFSIDVTYEYSLPPTPLPTAMPTVPTINPSRHPSVPPTTAMPSTNPIPAPTNVPTSSPSPAPTMNPTPAPTTNPTRIPTSNPTTRIPTIHPTQTPTHNPTSIPTQSPTDSTLKPTANPSISPTKGPTLEPTSAPTLEPTFPTVTPTQLPSVTPTALPSIPPTMNPTPVPSINPTPAPSTNPTRVPTMNPSITPTSNPSRPPTMRPTLGPTMNPTPLPTDAPIIPGSPTTHPTPPTPNPTDSPSVNPTPNPTRVPSVDPSVYPTVSPTRNPSANPSNNPSYTPSYIPTVIPSTDPTVDPTSHPSYTPSDTPTAIPSNDPTVDPSSNPSEEPTWFDTMEPTNRPTPDPTALPTNRPTKRPTSDPTTLPTRRPTAKPTGEPTTTPSDAPTIVDVQSTQIEIVVGNDSSEMVVERDEITMPVVVIIFMGSAAVCVVIMVSLRNLCKPQDMDHKIQKQRSVRDEGSDTNMVESQHTHEVYTVHLNAGALSDTESVDAHNIKHIYHVHPRPGTKGVRLSFSDRLNRSRFAVFRRSTIELEKPSTSTDSMLNEAESQSSIQSVSESTDDKMVPLDERENMEKFIQLVADKRKTKLYVMRDDDDDDEDEDEIAEVNEIIGNHGLSEAFHTLARDLDVLDPKDPEQDIFKEQIVGDVKDGTSSTEVISARKSLAISYVNAFVNAGYGRDKFMMSGGSDHGSASVQTANDWIAKNKERGQLASVASIGTIMLWDEEAANCVDRYFESNQSHIRAGAYLAIGISCSGMKSESGMGLALLSGPALNEDGNKTVIERLCAILGLGLSYAGQNDSESQVFDTLGQLISTEESDSISSLSALCLGYVYVGTCSVEICNIILSDLMERDPATLNNPLFLLNVLGLALLFLGKQQEVDVTLEAMDVFDELNPKFGKTCKVCLECLAYAGTGNVLKIQKMLGILGEHFDDEFEDEETKKKKEEEKKEGDKKQQAKDDDDDENEKKNKTDDYRYYQSIATLGISIIALGEDLGSTMCLRMFNHLIQYGNIRVKRAVPLALAMISVSNPLLEISDTLSKLSHDHDEFVSRNAIFALGIIGAGTNNARIARMLRSLTQYYGKEPDHLYMIRIAQGLIHLGKGLLTIKCFHSDRFLLSKVSICGILTSLFCNIGTSFPPKEDPSLSKEENTVPWSGNTISLLSDFHYLLYTLNLCIKPRMLITLDALNLKPLLTTVRVGQALDTVGQAGKNPKRITGFQTHETPILLQYNDRAILAQDTFVSVCSVLEGFAILRKNPESEQEKKKRRKQEKEKLKANKNQ